MTTPKNTSSFKQLNRHTRPASAIPTVQLPVSRIDTLLTKIDGFYKQQEESEQAQRANQVTKKPQVNIIKRQIYMQHLEKKLNEITTIGKEGREFQANQSQQKSKEISKQLQIDTSTKNTVTQQKKLRICKQFIATGRCRNKESCNLAHSISELATEYFPQTWINHFSKNKSELSRPQSAAYTTKVPLSHSLLKISPKAALTSQMRPQTANLTPQMQDQKKKQNEEISFIITKEKDISRTQSANKFHKTKISVDPDIDKIFNSKGRTLLMEAVSLGNIEGVQNLLLNGANPNLTDWRGENSMVIAIKKNFNDIIGILLDFSQYQIDLNCRFFSNKMTYLMMAARLGQSNIIKTLLNASADPNITDDANRTAIFYSIFKNDLESIYDLVEGGTQLTITDEKKKTCVDYAYQKKEIDLIHYLFQKGGALADNIQQHKIMFFAVENNNLSLVYEMIKRGNSPLGVDSQGNNLMLLAIKHQYYGSVIELCEDYSLFQLIHQNNKQGMNCIFASIKEQAYSLTKYFIHHAKTLDCVDNEGKTPLIYAAESGQEDLVQLILNKEQQDINKQDKKQGTALIYAAKSDNLLSVQHILNYKQTAKAYLTDVYGRKARHYCKNQAVKGMINHFMVEQSQLSESLIKDIAEEEEQLNKKVLFRFQQSALNEKRTSLLQSQQSFQIGPQLVNTSRSIDINNINSNNNNSNSEVKFKRVKIMAK